MRRGAKVAWNAISTGGIVAAFEGTDLSPKILTMFSNLRTASHTQIESRLSLFLLCSINR